MAIRTYYRVEATNGADLGERDTRAEARELLDANPGARIRPVCVPLNPCASHPRQEADNCVACGTAYDMGAKWR